MAQGNGHAFLLEGKGLKKSFSFIGNQEAKIWGIISRNITHHITIEKFVLGICIWQITYLKLTIRSCNNVEILYLSQPIRLYSLQTIELCKHMLMSYVHENGHANPTTVM